MKVFNRSEVLDTEGTLPFADTYCSLVVKENKCEPLIIANTATDVSTSVWGLPDG